MFRCLLSAVLIAAVMARDIFQTTTHEMTAKCRAQCVDQVSETLQIICNIRIMGVIFKQLSADGRPIFKVYVAYRMRLKPS